ncbi:MAG: MBL fold metallo-hydrolase [Flammeovirgaceae bacterium]
MRKKIKNNPTLQTIKSGYEGNTLINGIYVNGDVLEHPKSFWEVLKWQMSKNPQKKEKKEEGFQLKVIDNSDFLHHHNNVIVWLGHACFFIRINEVNILTDPCLTDLPLVPRKAGLPCEITDIQHLDYILMSHGHRDHFDIPSLKPLLKNNPDVEFLTPLDMHPLLNKLGNTCYQEAGWWQSFQIEEDITIHFLPAIHWNRRGITDFNLMLWGSFMITDGKTKIYFAGDTAYGNHFKEIGGFYENIDFCLMPIGAYKPIHFMKDAHISPEDAVKAFNELEARHFIPMHYGTYDLSDEPLGEPIKMMRNFHDQKQLNGNLQELAIGEEYLF